MQFSNDVILTFIGITHEILAHEAQYFLNLSLRKTLTELDLQDYDAVVLVLAFPTRSHSIGGTMIKLDIVNLVADRTGVAKQKAEQVVDSLFDAMKEALAQGKRIELRGFGVFVVKARKRGVGRNPRTGTEVPIPEGKTIRFKPGKELSAKAVG
jgi:DNA-binding protein HU-beta